MPVLLTIAFAIAILLLVAGGIYYSIQLEKKRRESLAQIATELGLTFFPTGDDNLMHRLSGFRLFNQGRGKTMSNLIQGDSGEVQIAIFDYQYTTGSGKQTHTHRMSVASLQSSELRCPDFTMRPENFLDKIGGALGFQDVDFESHPTFSKQFVLQGSDENALRQFMQPKLLEFFETRPGISVETQPAMMFFYRTGKRVKPEEIKDLLANAYEVFGYMVDK